jgi:hypothetical protein
MPWGYEGPTSSLEHRRRCHPCPDPKVSPMS